MHSTVNSFAREVGKIFDDYLKPLGLATSYAELLMMLSENEGMQQQEIAGKMNLAPSTITRFIAKLEKKKLVKKRKKTGRSDVLLTEKGAQKTEQIKIEYARAVEEMEKLLGEKFVATTEQLLKHGTDQLIQREL
jgi:DNA-binding MarR family transcriptional regulator